MDKTAIQSSVPPASPAPAREAVPQPRALRTRGPAWRVLTTVGSLRITVVLFVLAMILVLAGTLAQIDLGIWTVVGRYFRSLYVRIPFQIFFPRQFRVPGSFPFPGGFTIGGALLCNLFAAHAIWLINLFSSRGFNVVLLAKRSGILVLHAGLVVLMVSEFITHLYAVEGNMTIVEGGSSNFVYDSRHPELAILTPLDDSTDEVVAVPQSRLKKGGRIQDDHLPFDVEVVRYMVNSSRPGRPGPGQENPATAGDGRYEVAVERPEISGTDPEQNVDLPSVYLKLTEKGTSKDLGTYLVSMWYSSVGEDRPQVVTVNNKTYELYFRPRRIYKPYTLHLIDFNHEVYPGTDTPKDFSSVVQLTDPEMNEDREVRIWMNHPLRYRGETFYQSSFLPGDTGTILQVVRNPGWLMPYIACGMVSGGLLIHFGLSLVNFLQRRQTI